MEEGKVTDYKKNHGVPRFMLEYWVDPSTSHKGVHVHEVKSRRSYVSTGEGKKAFSFAITNDLYIHTGYGNRAVGLERWFSRLEDALAALVHQVHVKKEPIEYTSFTYTKTLMAIISLECRSPYNIQKIQKAIEEDKSLREIISPDPSHPLEQQILENIVHLVSEQVESLTPTEMIFFLAPRSRSWVIGDRPYLTDDRLEYRFVVLTNKVLLGYRRSPDEDKYQYQEVKENFIENINRMITLQAREWLVADTSAILQKYVTLFDSDEWRTSVAADHISLLPVRNLTSGWTINK
jgi:hypothetical protein